MRKEKTTVQQRALIRRLAKRLEDPEPVIAKEKAKKRMYTFDVRYGPRACAGIKGGQNNM